MNIEYSFRKRTYLNIELYSFPMNMIFIGNSRHEINVRDEVVGLAHPDVTPDRPGFLFSRELLPSSSYVGTKLGELAHILLSARLCSQSYKLELPVLSLAPMPNPQFPFPTDRAARLATTISYFFSLIRLFRSSQSRRWK